MHRQATPLRFILAFSAAQLAGASRAALAVAPVPSVAGASRVATVQVRVAPDHPDWTYALGERVKFTVKVVADNEPLPGAVVHFSVGPEAYPAREADAEVPAGGLVVEAAGLTVPGFIRCSVSCEVAGRRYRGLATAGYVPGEIRPTQTEPADFDAFWQAGKEALAAIPMEPQLTLWPEQCTPLLDVYHVRFQNIGAGSAKVSKLYGVLCVPKGRGPFPAVLRIPGAGVRPYFGEKEIAARGIITLVIGIHGIPVNLPQEMYDQLAVAGLSGYPFFNLADRGAYYYRRVVLGCLRANDFLCSLSQFDGRNLIVVGSSQGGFLALATAALDPRVRAADVLHPAFCDVTGYLHGRAGGWPHMFRPDRDGGPNPHATPQEIAVTGYYDGVNFARRVKIPCHFDFGYNDETCPPTSMFAAYNVITAPKTLTLALELGHGISPEQTEATANWVVETAGAKGRP